MVTPEGTLNIGIAELGPYESHIKLATYPQLILVMLSAYEGLVRKDAIGDVQGVLASKWSVAADNVTWTFELQEGVQFQGGYGEMTSEDVLFSMAEAAQNPVGGFAGRIGQLWADASAVGDHAVKVVTPVPAWDILVNLQSPHNNGTYIISKKHVDAVGEDEANRGVAGTGPWEFAEARTGEFWKFNAVQDHWRQTPAFAELVFHEIPEESTRVANFETGRLDTFYMDFDSLPAVERVPGVKFMVQPGAIQSHLGMYGSHYSRMDAESFDPDTLPYVSPDSDPSSAAWEKARKVRQAMAISIDRDLIIKEVLRGFGEPAFLWYWMGHERRSLPNWQWEYNPDKAKQLLSDAGYPNGFDLTLTLAVRGAPGESGACEAIADMWRQLGLNVTYQAPPFGTYFPSVVAREYKGVACHAVGPFAEPVNGYFAINVGSNAGSGGADHPIMDELILRGNDTFDIEERWKIQTEVGKFMFDNALDIGLYNVSKIWPLGPKIDDWSDDLATGDPRQISGLEHVPHRR